MHRIIRKTLSKFDQSTLQSRKNPHGASDVGGTCIFVSYYPPEQERHEPTTTG